jgi:hypothetical protein
VDVEEAVADVGLVGHQCLELEPAESLLEFGGRARDLGGRRGVVGVVGDEFGEFERVGNVARQRLPGLDLALELLELAQVDLGLVAVVPEVGPADDLFELFEVFGAAVEVKDTAGRGRPSRGSV